MGDYDSTLNLTLNLYRGEGGGRGGGTGRSGKRGNRHFKEPFIFIISNINKMALLTLMSVLTSLKEIQGVPPSV